MDSKNNKDDTVLPTDGYYNEGDDNRPEIECNMTLDDSNYTDQQYIKSELGIPIMVKDQLEPFELSLIDSNMWLEEKNIEQKYTRKNIDALTWKDNCEECGKMFSCFSKLARHKREVHVLKRHCEYCSWTCRGKQQHHLDKQMSEHVNVDHSETLKECGDTFSQYISQTNDPQDAITVLRIEKKSLREQMVLHVLEYETLAQKVFIQIDDLTTERDKLQKEKLEAITEFTEESKKDKDIIKQLDLANQTLQIRYEAEKNKLQEQLLNMDLRISCQEETLKGLEQENQELSFDMNCLEEENTELQDRLSDHLALQKENDMLYASLNIERKEHEEVVASLESKIKMLCDDLENTKDKFLNTATDLQLIRLVANNSLEKTTSNLSVSETQVLQQKIDKTNADARILAEDYTKNIEQFKSGKVSVKKIIDSGKYAKGECDHRKACTVFENEGHKSDDTSVEGEVSPLSNWNLSLNVARKNPRKHKNIYCIFHCS